MTPYTLGAAPTAARESPVIGIGAGPACSGRCRWCTMRSEFNRAAPR